LRADASQTPKFTLDIQTVFTYIGNAYLSSPRFYDHPSHLDRDMTYPIMIIGAGINGLATCYHLSKLGVQNIGLIERFDHGHNRGSSHGQSRITRSAYVNEHYVRLMQIAHNQAWPQLEQDAQTQLIYPTPGCFFGPPGGKYTHYEKAVLAVGVDVEPLTPQEARKRFPAFRFENAAGALHDRTAGLVAASKTMQSLSQLAQHPNITTHTNTEVIEIDPTQSPIKIITNASLLPLALVRPT
jgi:glycine/D-amino acid oxidase-like deaminating enzyme